MAVEKGHAGTVRALLEGKANLTANALHVAAEKEKIEVPKQKNWVFLITHFLVGWFKELQVDVDLQC